VGPGECFFLFYDFFLSRLLGNDIDHVGFHFISALAAIRAILNVAQNMLEVEGEGRWKVVTLIGGRDGVQTAQVLP